MATADRDWSLIMPPTALANIMSKAGQSGRHGRNSPALVCKSWAEAVAAADVLVGELDVQRCASLDSLQCWLQKHGQHLHTVLLHSVKGLSALPCPKLQHLSLRSCEFDVTSSNCSVWHSISTATALSSLHINKCRLLVHGLGSPLPGREAAMEHLLAVLAPLTDLQELSMCGVVATHHKLQSNNPVRSPVLLRTTVLQRMQHLTQLHLDAERVADELLQHVGSMTDLQDLRLGGAHGLLQGCGPLRLTVTHLTALTKLQRLGLRRVTLHHNSSAAALLVWLPSLQGLSSLQLRQVEGLDAARRTLYTAPGADATLYPPSTAYRALTAGSALQHIDLRDLKLTWDNWQRAFPLVRKFTTIYSMRFCTSDCHCNYFAHAVGSCPNLKELQAEVSPFDLQQLQQHTCLTRLTWRSPLKFNSYTTENLGLLTQLQSLQLLGLRMYCISDDLQPLTSLTRLSYLGLEVCTRRVVAGTPAFKRVRSVFDRIAATAELCEGGEAIRALWTFVSQAPLDSPPDVSAQLQAAIKRTAELLAAGSMADATPVHKPAV